MIVPFIIGFIYFAIKAYRVKENILLYGILCGIGTGIGTLIFTFLFKAVVVGQGDGGLDETTATIIVLILIFLAIFVVDRWSGLHWDIEKHNEAKEKEEENRQKLSSDEIAEITRLQIQKGEGSLDELRTYEATLPVEVKDENEVEKLELTQNSLPGEIDYIVIPDTIQKTLAKNEKSLTDIISDYKKYIEDEWTEGIPMYAAIELDKTGFVFTPEIVKYLDDYAKKLKFKNFVDLLTYYIPK